MTPDDIARLADHAYADANQFDAHRKSLPAEFADWADEISRGMRNRVAELRTLAQQGKAGGVPSEVIEAAARYGWQHASWPWKSVRGGLDRFVTPPAHSPEAGVTDEMVERYCEATYQSFSALKPMVQNHFRKAVRAGLIAALAPQPKDAPPKKPEGASNG